MNWKWLSGVLGVCSLLLISSCSEVAVYEEHETVYKIGNHESWASKELNTSNWTQRRPRWVPDGQVFWSRTSIEILTAPQPMKPYGIYLEIYGAYEVFWDGVKIGKNGNPGQEDKEVPEGEIWTTYIIPAELTTEGMHTLALRTSLLHFPDHTRIFDMKIDQYDDLITDRLVVTAYMYLFAGAFLITSIYFLFLFFSNKKEYPTLVFSICCFLVFALVIIVFSNRYVPLHYSLHVTRLQVICSLIFGISFLIPLYFSQKFPFPKRPYILAFYASILLVIFSMMNHSFPLNMRYMALSMWIFSFGIAGYGVYKKVRGARLILSMLIVCLSIFFVTSFSVSIYVGFGLTLLGMLHLLSLSSREQRLAYEESLVQSTRLRLELLKKNIQPHFLMNTLTSLIDWIEEAPKKGVLFIEALAKEFDLINQMENQTLIPVAQEIALCRAHLEIMEYRKEINYSWQEEGIDPEEKIPPAVLHTLLENGITHSLPLEDNSIRFKLVFEAVNSYKQYTFLTFAANVRDTVTLERKEGTGLKYIRARLTESYDSKWELTSEPADHGWKNIIKIYC